MNADTDLRSWFESIPPVTRFLTFGKLITTVIGHYGMINPYLLILTWKDFYGRFQIWRPVTAGLFGGGLSFMFLFGIVFFYRFCKSLEEGAYRGKRAEFVWAVAIMWTFLSVGALLLELPIFGRSLELAIIYLWSQLNKEQIVNFFFGIQIKAMYFPWALLGLDLLTGAPFTMTLLGIAVGHALFFLEYVYPEASGISILPKPPAFLRNWYPEPQGANMAGFGGTAPQGRARAERGGTGHSWGRGNTLGGN